MSSVSLPYMSNWNERIRAARKSLGISQAEFARRVGVSGATVSEWERELIVDIEARNLDKAARVLGVTPEFLLRGGALESGSGPKRATGPGWANVSPGPDIRGGVPLISLVRAGEWCEARDDFAPGDAEEWIPTLVQIRRHTFAVRVEGDSMEPDFPTGCILIVEPDMTPEPGDYVIAKLGEEATFKQLVKDMGVLYLKPLNPRYPVRELPADAHVCGVVRDVIRRLR